MGFLTCCCVTSINDVSYLEERLIGFSIAMLVLSTVMPSLGVGGTVLFYFVELHTVIINSCLPPRAALVWNSPLHNYMSMRENEGEIPGMNFDTVFDYR